VKLETLAKRLAEKTGVPLLEQVVLGKAPVTDLSMDHIIWRGALKGNGEGLRLLTRRDANNVAYPDFIRETPYGVIMWQKRRISVHRLLFQLTTQPDYEYRMYSDCQIPGCVHPLHWTVEKIERTEPEPDEVPDFEISGGDDWTPEEVVELVEILLTEQAPKNWEEVIAAELMEGVPEGMLRNCLNEMGKGHLT